jgi:hypothetical protein
MTLYSSPYCSVAKYCPAFRDIIITYRERECMVVSDAYIL